MATLNIAPPPPQSPPPSKVAFPEKSDEFYIKFMIEAATLEGMEIEVIRDFGAYRHAGDDVKDAVFSALSNWDIPGFY